MARVKIKYGDDVYETEGDYDEVCKAIVDGKPLDVITWECADHKCMQRITFFGDPDWVAVEL